MKKNTVVHGLAILLMAVMVTACASPGMRKEIPFTMPEGEKLTIVVHNQIATDWMLDRDKLALNYIVKGDVSAKQLAAIATVEENCRIETGYRQPNKLFAVLSSGALYGVAGFVGLGLGSQVFPAVRSLAYGAYGGVAGFTGGVANGIVNLGSQSYIFENCGRDVFSLSPNYKVRVMH